MDLFSNTLENRRRVVNFLYFSILNILIFLPILYIKANKEKIYYINDKIIYSNKEKLNDNLRFLDLESINYLENINHNNTLYIDNGWSFNLTKEIFLPLSQKQLFLLKLINKNYIGKIIHGYFDGVIIENISKVKTDFNSTYIYFKVANIYKEFNLTLFKYIENKTNNEILILKLKSISDNNYNNSYDFWYIDIKELTFKIDTINKIFSVQNFSFSNLKINLINQKKCEPFIDIEFPLKYFHSIEENKYETIHLKIPTINSAIFNSSIHSKCVYKIKIKEIISFINETKIKYNSIIKNNPELDIEDIQYSLILIFISILNSSATYFLIASIKKHIYLISAISLESYCLNYLSHFYYVINIQYIFLKSLFNINTWLYGLSFICTIGNFLFFDCGFIFMICEITESTSNSSISLKKRFRLIMYIILLDTLYLYTIDLRRLIYIIISVVTWTPQIFHNMVYNNRFIYPLYYIIIFSFDKFVFMIYLYKFNEKPSKLIIFISSTIIFLTIIILYLQTFLGTRFMLPLRFQKKELNLYKSKNEILNENPEVKNEECSICLLPFIENDKKNENNLLNNNIEIIVDNNINTNKIDFSFDENIQQNEKNKNNIMDTNYIINNLDIKKAKKKYKKYDFNKNFKQYFKLIKSIFIEGFFKFYKGKPLFFKSFILLPCNHIFHSNCLEKWIGVRKECPICRASLSQYI